MDAKLAKWEARDGVREPLPVKASTRWYPAGSIWQAMYSSMHYHWKKKRCIFDVSRWSKPLVKASTRDDILLVGCDKLCIVACMITGKRRQRQAYTVSTSNIHATRNSRVSLPCSTWVVTTRSLLLLCVGFDLWWKARVLYVAKFFKDPV